MTHTLGGSGQNGPVSSPTFRLMTVCTGNICRSPMAEIVLRDRLEAAGLADRVAVDSTGISDEERGNPVDPRAVRVLAAHGYPTGDGHCARQVRADELRERDLVLAMTAQHARYLRRLAPDAEVRMFRSFDPAAPRLAPGDSEHVLDVDDPWYGEQAGFETTLSEIEAAADGIVEHVRAALAGREGAA
jgi:protein-tyrosine phosphatase